jgi:hypothetical protein
MKAAFVTRRSPFCFVRAKAGLALALLCAGCRPETAAPKSEVEAIPVGIAVPETGAYLGAYIDSGDDEDEVSLDKLVEFEELAGKKQAIVASSSYWGQQTFPSANLRIISRHGSIPLLFWSPWDKPYEQNKGPDRYSLDDILEGKWDAYIDRWADGAREYGRPFFVAWGLEMNGNWFPWSGIFYDGKKAVPGSNPVAFEGPERFKRCYRYVVDRVRGRGAKNILWVFHANNFSEPPEEWNRMAQYYPGADYVDWLAVSAYGKQFPNEPWADLLDVLEDPYQELCELDPTKPIMLAEFGVGEFPSTGDKAEWFKEAFAALEYKMPRIKAAVYWHERWQNEDQTYSNLRINSSGESLEAYRTAVSDRYWLERPIWR